MPPNLSKPSSGARKAEYGVTFKNVKEALEFHDLQLFDLSSLGDKHKRSAQSGNHLGSAVVPKRVRTPSFWAIFLTGFYATHSRLSVQND